MTPEEERALLAEANTSDIGLVGALTEASEVAILEEVHDAVLEATLMQGVPLPPGSHVRVAGDRRDDAVMIRVRSGGMPVQVLTDAGVWRDLGSRYRLVIGPGNRETAEDYAQRVAAVTAEMKAALARAQAAVARRAQEDDEEEDW